MKTIGYLEGTDGIFLTRLAAMGYDTLPLGNGADNHGKNVTLVDRTDSLDLVVGYYHKVLPLKKRGTTTKEMLQSCLIHKIPVLLIVPYEFHEKVRKNLNITSGVILVDPEEVMTETEKILSL